MILSRAPVRICDIGGWTDTWFFPNGAIFNICVDLYTYVRLVKNHSNEIKIISENLNQQTIIKDVSNIEFNGNLDLVKAVVKRMNVKAGLDIFIRADAPPGCGTGTSASVSVSLIAALAELLNKNLDRMEIARIAHEIEIKELELESGIQDQYAAALGGINFMEINYPLANVYPLELDVSKICQLESQLLLVYINSRSSDELHKAVIENYKQGDDSTHNALETIKRCAYEMKKALILDNLENMGEIMNRNWAAQKKLHPLMNNPIIQKIENISRENGAIGFKLNGAGGGGSATILAGIGSEYNLKKKLIQNELQLLPIKLDFKGVQTWKVMNEY